MDTVRLNPTLRRWLLGGLLILSLIVIFEARKFWLAARWLDSEDSIAMKKSVGLVGDNADAWDHLGRYYLLGFSDPDAQQAVDDFHRAVRIAPLSANYWMDLGSAYDAVNDAPDARAAYQQAKAVYPASATAEWTYGNFLLRQGDMAGALDEIQHAVRGNPQLLTLAVSRVWHASGDVNQLLDRVIPSDTDSYLRTIDFFGSTQQIAPGMAVWQRLVALKEPFDLKRISNFMEDLIRSDDGDDARRVWTEAIELDNLPQLAISNESPVADGAFQASFPNCGLGWWWENTGGASIDFDSSTPKGKGRSVRLDFSGGVNLDLSRPEQYVVVEPGRAYHFHAALRTDQLSTESGVRFAVSDPNHSGVVLARSDNFTGSHPWTSIDVDLAASPSTHIVLIQLIREPSHMFENQLSGTAWIADISLTPSVPQP